MVNSVIVAIRNRHEQLRCFLKSIEVASKKVDQNSFELVITDLGSSEPNSELINKYLSTINIKYDYINYSGIFWKTKALNHSAKISEGQLITVIDCDSIVPPNFFANIQNFFSSNGLRNKLCHRVRFIDNYDNIHTALLSNPDIITEEWIEKKLISNSDKLRLARERFLGNNTPYKDINKKKFADNDLFNNKALGNSHFTIFKEDYMHLGGFDERFIGWGLEDMDMNRRIYKCFGKGTLIRDPGHTIFHVYHSHDSSWTSKNHREHNRKAYASNKAKNVIGLPIDEGWGSF